MIISLHKNATTTPGIRQRMAQSDEPAAVLAQRYGVSEKTALKWKRRGRLRGSLAHRTSAGDDADARARFER